MELAALCDSLTAFCQRIQTGLEQATFEQKRQLVELLVDRVIVTMDEVEIRYVIPTSSRSEQTYFYHLHTNYFITEGLILRLGTTRDRGNGGVQVEYMLN